VTNQQGVAKGKMSEDMLRSIHLNMLSNRGSRWQDRLYLCRYSAGRC
jgi:histidinol phosphatase-like enzyme